MREPTGHLRPAAALGGATALLALAVLASLAVGSSAIGPGTVVHALVADDGSTAATVVRTSRLPRTLLGLLVGAALGLAGALLQALTRNPLADPGLLGVNAGAAAAVVVGVALLGAAGPAAQLPAAVLGAGLATLVVAVLGSRGRGGEVPVRLALAGAAVSAALGAVVSGLVLARPDTFDSYRNWSIGALAGRDPSVLATCAPLLAVGIALGLSLARPLDALALGEHSGRALGVHVGRVRAGTLVAATLCAGGATAAAGPVGFVGLAVPHAARVLVGPSQRALLPLCAVLAPTLLLAADVVGRVVARPGEIEVGIVTAVLGAPVFLALVRRRRPVRL